MLLETERMRAVGIASDGVDSGMEIDRVRAIYFSATGTTGKVVTEVAHEIAANAGAGYAEDDFTLPAAREKRLLLRKDELVVFGTPVYAGRVPNVLLKYLETIEGNGAPAIPIVVFGNRDYDDALAELRDILVRAGCHVVAAAAFVGEHAFSDTLAKGRPDEEDLALAKAFSRDIMKKVWQGSRAASPLAVKGTPYPYRGYYQPRDRAGNAIDIRKVKPLTNENCDDCGLCADICPMGSISRQDVREYTGICIKCGACIKRCPQNAKYYEDEGYLYHKHELEEGYRRRANVELFL